MLFPINLASCLFLINCIFEMLWISKSSIRLTVQNTIFHIKNITNMQQVPKITNTERLEKQVTKDAHFWLPLVTYKQMIWLNEGGITATIPLPKNL